MIASAQSDTLRSCILEQLMRKHALVHRGERRAASNDLCMHVGEALDYTKPASVALSNNNSCSGAHAGGRTSGISGTERTMLPVAL